MRKRTHVDDLAVALAVLDDAAVEAADDVWVSEALVGCRGALTRSVWLAGMRAGSESAPSTSLRAALTESDPSGQRIFLRAKRRFEALSCAR